MSSQPEIDTVDLAPAAPATPYRSMVKSVRFSPEEWAEVEEKAAEARVSPARFLRIAALGRTLPKRPAWQSDVIRQLAAIGNNLNQLTRTANIGNKVDDQLLEEALGYVVDAIRKLDRR